MRGNRLAGIGLSALTATNSQQVFRSVAVHSTTGRFNCKRYAEQVGARQILGELVASGRNIHNKVVFAHLLTEEYASVKGDEL